MMSDNNTETWAVCELMGHVTLAGRVSKPGEYGGLWQLDIPDEGDGFHTEFFGSQAVYRIRIVSEEIARAYAGPSNEVIEYNAPIVTRAEHENAMQRARVELSMAHQRIEELRRRLTAVQALPAPPEDGYFIGSEIDRDKLSDLEFPDEQS
jgi:hypothetical protein